jgi:repressor LexA
MNMVEKLEQLMNERGLTKADVARESGIPYTTFDGLFKKGYEKIKLPTLKAIADYFNVTMEYLANDNIFECKVAEPTVIYQTNNKNRVPVLGKIPAGAPVIAIERVEGYEETDDSDIDFCLRVTGNSMIGARIYEGDIVYVDTDAEIENGDIVVALVDGENATLKRFYRRGNSVVLKPENSTMKELVLGPEDKDFRIIGKVKEVKFKV